MEIPDNWLPTPSNINALPVPIRKYIHDLETRTDPAGDVRRIAELKDQVETLQVLLGQARQEARKALRFPPHKASLHLTHNDHKSNYETMERWALRNTGDEGFAEWVNDEQRDLAIATDEVWTLQWYPETPVGFHALAAADLDALLAAAIEDEVKEREG